MEESHTPPQRFVRRVRVSIALLAAAFATAQAWAAELFSFDIPAGSAEETLQLIYPQSQLLFIFIPGEVKGIRTNAVLGEFTPEEALRLMLEGTGLEYRATDRVIVRVVESGPRPGTPHENGSALAIRGLPSLASTFASKEAQELQEVVVTGTLIRGVFDIVSPLTFVKRDQLRRAGYGGVRDALLSLPISFGGGPSEYLDPGGNFNRGASINLRGIGAGATLVLVNGRRQPFGGFDGDFVDVSSIPWSAVERVEVLPDGASASYGADAVAGVVNVIMRDDFEGMETQARVGFTEGGADETVVSQLYGTRWDSGRLFFGYQYSDRSALAASDRYYTASGDKRPLGGRNFLSLRSNPGNIFDLGTQQPAFGIPYGQDGTALDVDALLPGVVHYKNQFASFDLIPERRMHSAYFSVSQSAGERLEFFGEARVAHRDMKQMFAPAEEMLVVPASNPFFLDAFEANLPIALVGYDFSADLGPSRAAGSTSTYVGSAGVRADFGLTWKASASVSYGTERMHWNGYNQVDDEALDAALRDPDPATAFNPFGDGSHTNPQTLDKVRTTLMHGAETSVSAFNLIADGEVLELPSGAAKLAVGMEYREERLEHGVRAPLQFGRHVASAFAELALPILGNADDRFDTPRLQLSLAGRGERFSDFGSTFNPKIGLQWVPTSSVKVRGSWGTSFKAPDLVDLYDTSSEVAGLLLLRDPLSASGRSIVLIHQGPNPELHEETASTWTAGLDLAPTSLAGLTMSLTYFSIKYDDRVFTPGQPLSPETVLADRAWAEIVTRNPSVEQITAVCSNPQCVAAQPAAIIDARPRNLSGTTVEGVDLDLNQSLDTRFGAFAFGLQGSYMWNFGQELTSASPMLDVLDTVANPIALRMRGSIRWDEHGADLPGLGVELSLDHVSGYDDDFSPVRRHVDAWTRLNVNLSYRMAGAGLDDGLEFMLSGLNVFDAAPPFVDQELGYDFANAEPIGRVVSFYVRKNW